MIYSGREQGCPYVSEGLTHYPSTTAIWHPKIPASNMAIGEESLKTALAISPAEPESDISSRPKELERRDTTGLNVVKGKDVDDAALFYNTHRDAFKPLDEDGRKRLTRKNFWCLLSQTWWIAFLIHLDKSTLSQASTMGIFDDVEWGDNQKNKFNDLFVVFYAGYLVALWPGAMLAQRVGHKLFINVSLLLWALLLGMHPLAKTSQHLMVLRFFLGMVSIPKQ